MTVSTGDDLELRLHGDGTPAGLTVDGRAVAFLPETGGFHVTECLPPGGAWREWGVVRGMLTTSDGAPELRGQWTEAGLDLTARFQARAGYIEVEGEVADRTGHDRALLVTFRLPLRTEGRKWGDDIERVRRVSAGQTYAMDDRFGERGDMPVSRLPFSALTGEDVGLSLGVPMHGPPVFRLFCDAQGYQVSFALGLAPSVNREKARAGFRFLLYRHDPAWGLRSAAQRYYDFFPELYEKRVQSEGSWGFFYHNGAVPNLEDFGAVFCGVGQVTLTPEEAAYVKERGLYTFKHREPWAWWHRVHFAPDKDRRTRSHLAEPGDPPPPPLEEELAIIRKKRHEPPEVLDGNDQIPGPVREVAAAAERCFLYDENGQPRRLLWHLWWTPEGMAWHSQIPLNTNPRLPSPNRADLARRYQFQNMAAWEDPNAKHVNGVSFDSLTEWTGFPLEDYRRENFSYATVPLTFCPRNGRVVQLKGFHDWEMVRAWGEEIRSKGRFLMANTDTQPILFCGRYLDVMGIERSADAVSEEEMALVRTLCFRKPASYYREVTEKGMRKCLFYGIHPGGLQVLVTPERIETARPLFRKYAPLIQKLAAVGWHPLTHATVRPVETDPASTPHPSPLKIERFGDRNRGLYFTLRNAGDSPATAKVHVNLEALGLRGAPNLRVEELLEGRRVVPQIEGDALGVTVRIERGETLALAVRGLPAQQMRGRS